MTNNIFLSKYYDLNSLPPGWTADEFRFAVLTLESLSREDLIRLVAEAGISYPGTPLNEIEDEELIDVLFRDWDKGSLLAALNSSQGGIAA